MRRSLRLAVTVVVAAAFAGWGCSGDGTSEGTTDDAPSDFDFTMSQAELVEIAQANGIAVNAFSAKENILEALAELYGCECSVDETCGLSNCGLPCGPVADATDLTGVHGACGDGTACFAGECEAIADKTLYGFEPYAHATLARKIAGSTWMTYLATQGTDRENLQEPPFTQMRLKIVQESFSGETGEYDLAGTGVTSSTIQPKSTTSRSRRPHA